MKRFDIKDRYLWVLLASLMIFGISLFVNALFPIRYEIAIALFFVVFTAIGAVTKSKVFKIGLSVVLILASFAMFYSQNIANRLLEYAEFETNYFSFVVLRDSGIEKIEDTKDASIAHAKTLANGELEFIVGHMMDKHKISMDLLEMNNEFDMVEALYRQDIDVMILDNAVIPLLLDEDEFFETKVRVIYTISYDVIKENIGKDVNISKDGFIIFISGIDIEGPINLRSRSDVNILMVVSPSQKKILTISIPRDTYVNLGCRTGGKDKLTHAGIYGIGCSVTTVENLFDIEVNYYVRVNFTSLINIVNVVGPIDVYSQYAFNAGGYSFKTGLNTLNAEATLAFSRERYSLPGGDITRGLNQQEVIKGLVNKLIEPSSLLRVESIVTSTASSVDTNMPSSDLTKLVRLQLDQNIDWSFESMHLSGRGDSQPTYSMGSRLLYVMHPDRASIQEIRGKIMEFLGE